jgi:hypothetical protein
MNKWILCIFCILPFQGWAEQSVSKSEIELIEKQIQELKKRLHENEVKEMKEEVKAQEYVIADWDAYSKEVQHVRKREELEEQIDREIKKLEEQKARLQQSQAKKSL